jgi:DNA polymerase III delta subunit
MILKYSYFEKSAFLKEKKFFLFYGPNFGKIESCIKVLKSKLNSLDRTLKFLNFFQDDFLNHSFIDIVNQNNQDDIFGNKTSLIFSLSDLRISSEIIKVITSQELNIQNIIFKTGPIQKGLKIRKFFEDSPDCIIVPCYEDNLLEKKEVIMRVFGNENIEVSHDHKNLLASLLSNERLNLLNELNKLVIYIKTTKKNIINALPILIENSSQDLNNLVYLLASKKRKDFWNEFLKLQQTFSDEIKFINMFSKHLEKILFVKDKILLGSTPLNAMKSLRPPIFFKQEEAFLSQIDLWNFRNIRKIIKELHFCQMSILNNEKSSKSRFLTLITKILDL